MFNGEFSINNKVFLFVIRQLKKVFIKNQIEPIE